MRRSHRVLTLGLVLLSLSAGGCGGGGGDAGSGDDLVNYTGVTSKAVVDGANAGDLTDAAATGPQMGFGLREIGGFQAARGRASAGRTATRAAVAVVDGTRAAALQVPIDEAGLCSGRVTGNANFSDGSFLEFEATLVFSDYSDCETTLDGTISIVSRVRPDDTLVIDEAFSGLTVDEGTERVRLGGRLQAVGRRDGSSSAMTLNFAAEDLGTSRQIWFQDFTVALVHGAEADTASLGGRVYHSAHGYVDLATDPASPLAAAFSFPSAAPAALTVLAGDENPSSGGVLMVGDRGTAALLHPLSSAEYEVIVNTDGDSVLGSGQDTILGPFPWE